MPVCRLLLLTFVTACLQLCAARADEPQEPAGNADETISFYRHVRPILQRHCSGCHQPAKAGGTLLLTSYEAFKKGGENGAAFAPGSPDESLILDYIVGEEPLMPLNGDPLTPQQIELITRWIAQGATDDTPEGVRDVISADNPPVYHKPPVITSLDYSPDGGLLAVTGYHEVLLHKADGSERVGRLIGRSPRIASVRFSPDGEVLAVVGGAPALFGEVQFWNVAKQELVQSTSLSYDTLYGAEFSDDGKRLAFGGADGRARIINVEDGEVVMRLDAHADMVFGATFSLKNDHVITVSRDMAMKLTHVETAQFIDNITSITPGALKGGLMAVQRHPDKEQVLTGGADGEPKLYQIFRTKARKIGDDFNRIRGYQKLPGRIVSLDFNKDGSRFVVGSSNATSGAARIYDTEQGTLLHELPGHTSGVFAVSFRPDGKQVATGGFDGTVRLFDAESGKAVREFVPVELEPTVAAK